jgi:hypothetical protein
MAFGRAGELVGVQPAPNPRLYRDVDPAWRLGWNETAPRSEGGSLVINRIDEAKLNYASVSIMGALVRSIPWVWHLD